MDVKIDFCRGSGEVHKKSKKKSKNENGCSVNVQINVGNRPNDSRANDNIELPRQFVYAVIILAIIALIETIGYIYCFIYYIFSR